MMNLILQSHTADAAITYSGGGGSGATVIPVLGLTAGSFAVTSGGSGYTGNATVAITGGGGTGATGTAVQVGGVITSINITNAGTGYTSAPTITIAPPPVPTCRSSIMPQTLTTRSIPLP